MAVTIGLAAAPACGGETTAAVGESPEELMRRSGAAPGASSQAGLGSGPGTDLGTPSAQKPGLKMVGYDLRRLRPRDQPLGEMFDGAAQGARAEGKRVAVLFSADWCAPCRHLDIELGNMHPADLIGDVRVFELKEEEWKEATRMGEFNRLRSRWYSKLDSYPVFVMLDAEGAVIEEMKAGKARLEAHGLEARLPLWFESTRDGLGVSQAAAP